MQTRAEHLAWCKQRALEVLEKGGEPKNIADAWSSMASDLSKHPETVRHPAIQLGAMLFVTGNLSSKEKMSKFIVDFN